MSYIFLLNLAQFIISHNDAIATINLSSVRDCEQRGLHKYDTITKKIKHVVRMYLQYKKVSNFKRNTRKKMILRNKDF